MAEHLTVILKSPSRIRAVCPEHGVIGYDQPPTTGGVNAVVTEARAHDDIVHGVMRTDPGYRAALRAVQTTSH